MSQKTISIILLVLAFGFFIFKSVGNRRGGTSSVDANTPSLPAENVNIVDGKQIIDITARGGYSPRKTVAKAGVPTILKVNTNGSYDCSVALRIPKLGIAKNLEPTGTAEIDLGTPQVGLLRGLCGMGMYSFEINFQS